MFRVTFLGVRTAYVVLVFDTHYILAYPYMRTYMCVIEIDRNKVFVFEHTYVRTYVHIYIYIYIYMYLYTYVQCACAYRHIDCA